MKRGSREEGGSGCSGDDDVVRGGAVDADGTCAHAGGAALRAGGEGVRGAGRERGAAGHAAPVRLGGDVLAAVRARGGRVLPRGVGLPSTGGERTEVLTGGQALPRRVRGAG